MGAADDLARLVTERLTAQRITFGRAEAFSTPRRLTLVIHDLAEAQPDRAGAWTALAVASCWISSSTME